MNPTGFGYLFVPGPLCQCFVGVILPPLPPSGQGAAFRWGCVPLGQRGERVHYVEANGK